MSRIIALTGATGFVGGAVVRRLRGAGWDVRALVRPSHCLDNLRELGVDCVEGSLENRSRLRSLVDGVYAIVHCAGIVRGISPSQFKQVNVDGVAHLVDAALTQETPPRFLSLSSIAAREPELSPYAESKYQGECALHECADIVEWVALRPPALYGEGDRELLPLLRLMGKGFAPILGAQDAKFSLLHVDDLAAAILKWLKYGHCASGVYEIHDGREGGYSWDDVVKTAEAYRAGRVLRMPIPELALKGVASVSTLIARLSGYAPFITLGKVREIRHHDWVCNNTALSREISWEPEITFAEGLRLTLSKGKNTRTLQKKLL